MLTDYKVIAYDGEQCNVLMNSLSINKYCGIPVRNCNGQDDCLSLVVKVDTDHFYEVFNKLKFKEVIACESIAASPLFNYMKPYVCRVEQDKDGNEILEEHTDGFRETKSYNNGKLRCAETVYPDGRHECDIFFTGYSTPQSQAFQGVVDNYNKSLQEFISGLDTDCICMN